jgi:hypothetical protein
MKMSRPIDEQIAIRVQEFKIAFLALNQALVAMLHPDLPVLQFTYALSDTPPGGDLPMELVDPLNTKRVLSYPMAEVMAKASTLRGEVLKDLMSVGMTTAATRLGDMLKEGNQLRREIPLLQFAPATSATPARTETGGTSPTASPTRRPPAAA